MMREFPSDVPSHTMSDNCALPKPNINMPEIYLHILSFLDIPSSAKLMQVSLLWYELAGPKVYQDLAYDPKGHSYATENLFVNTTVPSGCSEVSTLRTSKIRLLEHCRILRAFPHDTWIKEDFEYGCTADECSLPIKFNPKIVILQMSKRIDSNRDLHLDFYNQPAEVENRQCALLRSVIPNKLVIKDWEHPCPKYVPGTYSHSSISKLVLVLAPQIPLGLDMHCVNSYLDWDWLEPTPKDLPTNITYVFQDVTTQPTQTWLSSVHPKTWVTMCADSIAMDHEDLPLHTTTIVNTESIQLCRLSNPTELVNFQDLFKDLFYDSLSGPLQFGNRRMQSVTEKDEMWSRVQSVSKEDYMNRDAKEIEGELDDLGW